MNFSQIIGQDSCKNHLVKAIESKHISHAYIICGEKGSGKSKIAKAFATILQCERGLKEACGECKSCRQIKHDNQPDIIYIGSDEKSTIPVKDIREKFTETVIIRPFSSKYKIYIIDGADRLSNTAQNTLLKTLEEPPEYVVIILLIESLDSLLSTVKSRCVQLFTTPVLRQDLLNYLVEKENITKKRAELLCSFSFGNIGKALEINNDSGFEKTISDVENIAYNLGNEVILEIPEAVSIILKSCVPNGKKSPDKDRISKYVELLELWFKDVLLCKSVGNADDCTFLNSKEKLIRQSNTISFAKINNILGTIENGKAYILSNVNLEMILETIIIAVKENTK